MTQDSIWRCPNCSLALVDDKSAWRCANQHTFDKAKQGYTNLLLANQKNSLEPGDSAEMISARRDFLRAGYYQPLAETLASLIHEFMPHQPVSGVCHVLDLGCGEGYYLDQIQSQFDLANSNHAEMIVRYHGMDISKVAVKKAAQSQANCQFAVASSYAIPVKDNSVDVALCVFAPVAFTEVQRVLKSNGVFVRVYPGSRHLYQLKSALYEQVTLHEMPKENTYFNLISDQQVTFTASIDNQQGIRHLLAMTPLNWRGNPDAKLQLLEHTLFEVDCDFYIQVLQSAI